MDGQNIAVGWPLAGVLILLTVGGALVVRLGRIDAWQPVVTAAVRAAVQLAAVSLLITAVLASGWLTTGFVLLMYTIAAFTAAGRIARAAAGGDGWSVVRPRRDSGATAAGRPGRSGNGRPGPAGEPGGSSGARPATVGEPLSDPPHATVGEPLGDPRSATVGEPGGGPRPGEPSEPSSGRGSGKAAGRHFGAGRLAAWSAGFDARLRMAPISAVAIAAGVLPVLALLLGTGMVLAQPVVIIPIAGIYIGGAMTATSIAGRRAYDELRARHGEYEAALALGLLPRDAALLIIRPTANQALVPVLDQTRTVGLVTLPGAFVGVLLGGGDPLQAGVIQIVVLIALLTIEAIAVLVTVELIAHRA